MSGPPRTQDPAGRGRHRDPPLQLGHNPGGVAPAGLGRGHGQAPVGPAAPAGLAGVAGIARGNGGVQPGAQAGAQVAVQAAQAAGQAVMAAFGRGRGGGRGRGQGVAANLGQANWPALGRGRGVVFQPGAAAALQAQHAAAWAAFPHNAQGGAGQGAGHGAAHGAGQTQAQILAALQEEEDLRNLQYPGRDGRPRGTH